MFQREAVVIFGGSEGCPGPRGGERDGDHGLFTCGRALWTRDAGAARSEELGGLCPVLQPHAGSSHRDV